MKKHLLFLILCLMGILTSCSQKHTRYYIGVSQCSDDEWRHKMNHEIVREALFYDGVGWRWRSVPRKIITGIR